MPYYIIRSIECAITFFFLIYTLCQTCGYKYAPSTRILSLLGFTIGLSLIYLFTFHFTPSYFMYFALMLLFGFLYGIFFLSAKWLNVLILISSFFYCINALNGILENLRDIYFPNSTYYSADRIVYYVIFYTLLAFCSLFFQKHPLILSTQMPLQQAFLMLLTPSVLMISAQFYIFFTQKNTGYRFFPTLFFLITFITVMGTYYLSYSLTSTYSALIDSKMIEQRQSLQIDHIERSIGMTEQIRRDKHEMKNVYFYIQSLLKSGQYQELENFVDTKLVHRYDRIEEFNTGNQFLDYLLTQKISEARDASIHFLADIIVPENLGINENDLCSLLLNLLDNAIDASKHETNGDIHLSMRVVKNYLSIKIKNKSSVDVLRENPKLITTKKDQHQHGIGLRVVKSIISKYNGILHMSMESGYFSIDIMLEMS